MNQTPTPLHPVATTQAGENRQMQLLVDGIWKDVHSSTAAEFPAEQVRFAEPARPEMPKPVVTYADHSYPAYSADQMRAYALAAIEMQASHSAAADAVPVAWRWKYGMDEGADYTVWHVSTIPLAPYGERVIEPLYAHPSPTTAPAATTPAASESIETPEFRGPNAYMVALSGGEAVGLHFQKVNAESTLKKWETAGEVVPLYALRDKSSTKPVMSDLSNTAASVDTVEWRELLMALLDAKGRSEDEYKEARLNFIAHINAHTAAQVAASKPAEVELAQIYDLFGIGSQARTIQTLMVSLRNVLHFTDLLHAVEREFFMVPGEVDDEFPDDEPGDECLVNCWGATQEEYVEQFRAALATISGKPAAASGEAIPVWELYKDGWDAVEGLDSDWMTTLPFGTKLYYLPNPAPQHQVQAGGDAIKLTVGVFVDESGACVSIHHKEGDTTTVIYSSNHPIGESVGVAYIERAAAQPESAAKPVDLAGLTRYDNEQYESPCPMEGGRYVLFADIEELLTSQPVPAPAPALPATGEALTEEQMAVLEEAAQVFESGAAHNDLHGRTVFVHAQEGRADKLRAIITALKGGAA